MCGITGFYWFSELDSFQGTLVEMANAISHRGPDHLGVWTDFDRGVGLAHRRLSILDPSPAGNQPMHSPSGRYVIIFNGEIYNHLALRTELAALGVALQWRGQSDTETLLAGFEFWGIETTIKRSVGMFALAIWDRQTRELTLTRDRLGEKPLYYGWQGSGNRKAFLFGSELKSLKHHPYFEQKICRGAVSLLLRHNYIPAPHSVFEGVFKLPAGNLLVLSASDCLNLQLPKPKPYWSLVDVAINGISNPWTGDEAGAIDRLDSLLRESVRQQMVADVPIGAFLSGGIDSSTVAALMQAHSLRPIQTFSIGFNEQAYNEAVHAKAISDYLGTEHHELYISPQQALSVIPKLPALYDEPFSDSSQIPTFLVAQLAKQHVTVSLSGDGGDEIFCGYNRYLFSSAYWPKIQLIPKVLRKALATLLYGVSPGRWDQISCYLPLASSYADLGEKLHKAAKVLGCHDLNALYVGLTSQWVQPADIVLQGFEPPTRLSVESHNLAELNSVQKMMAMDTLTYLPDDILAKVDRAAMACSLETRAPFLDHRIVEFSWTLPQTFKLRNKRTKWLLREVLSRYVPTELIERPKMGFSIPIDRWLRGPLREWAESLLDEGRLQREGFFNPKPIRIKWSEHLSGRRDWQHHLWSILIFQSWLEAQD